MGRFALFVVFGLTFALITYNHTLKSVMLSSQLEVTNGYTLTQAQNIAQSAAMIKVRQVGQGDESPISGTWEEMGGSYDVEIVQVADTMYVRSTGLFEGNEYLVEVKLAVSDPIWTPDITHAVFAGSSMNMSGSASIIGDVGTNAITANAITFTGNPQITGGLVVGPGGDPEEVLNAPSWKGTDSWVSGGVSSASQPFQFELPPFVDFPPQTNPGGSISLSGGTSSIIKASSIGSSYIPAINISGDNTLTIDTEGNDVTLHVGDLNVQQGHIKFLGDGEVTLLVEDNITLNGSSTINDNSFSEKVMTYYRGDNEVDFAGATTFKSNFYAETANIKLAGSGGLQGHVITGGNNVEITGAAEAISRVIYAPNASVELTGSGSVRGSIVSNTFSATGASTVTFEEDNTTEMPEIKTESGSPNILYWN
ncbi:MAG TPA: hypothetical protein DD671_11410 [Balneolaceae bacterium]|nr:hypothetical protein [Balneolaceae bacterium]